MLTLLDPQDRIHFPDVSQAMREPNGLLAVGGDLSTTRLRQAYRHGIFPWYSEGDPILWWSPDPRSVLIPEQVHVSRSLAKRLRRADHRVTFDRDFAAVIRACAAPRADEAGTWLVPEMIDAYERLHAQGLAHSVEVWRDDELIGGLYGVAVGKAFFGESMFSRASDGSKIALVQLCRRLAEWGFGLIDCQMHTHHLQRMGAEEIPRRDFIARLERFCALPGHDHSWDDEAHNR
ncbi:MULTISPECIES: leucyl/phenylalanyl-tRNA--protein transferase [Marichromatium]|uniref:Leucyl/phenylalanyl-tRNA--protein transferase n=1 Tax=Marichromatium gracile TaxID=1048 RepID=A0A4R4A988_MARGR|nr:MULTISPECIES: leucyl/phenylalanyl-tRNA--protein transferase [Marichromatium]MBK1708810.1 leucyl/phenylalanyl-tRNA--protein transferase [Marichromatium gracile]MBO8085466.1 leucyl/phenylalanyl-tRNA--protein transferase [Marichromatium sp.]RNE88974.1 leucyl/phenylalanyl-tRNA--protein transferase [Marichromatium sp. AB31]TCW35491.1 leucyl/phenylalanyl-tRNA--protein transferase [Marichromatium gracile]